MTELIAHEVKIAAIDSRCCDETYHLVQGYTSISAVVFVAFTEVPVHIGINKAEDNGLVAYKSLVVAFTIAYGTLIGTTVCDLPENRAWFPCFIWKFLDGLNPIVGDVHGHTIVEAIAAIGKLGSKSWHAADFLCDGYCIGINLMYKKIGKCQVADGIIVLMSVEVVAIVAESLAKSVAIIKH